MERGWLLALSFAMTQPLFAQTFLNLNSYDDWFDPSTSAEMKWSIHVTPATLEENQRLAVTVEDRFETEEVRATAQPFFLLIELRDAHHRKYRSEVIPVTGRRAGSSKTFLVR